VDIGEGQDHLFGGKKEEMTEKRKASRANKTKPPPLPFLLTLKGWIYH